MYNEMPTHLVVMDDFYISKYEVTQALWKAVMGNNPSRVKGDSLPVTCVSWLDARSFIFKLNKLTGKKFRLPTEAEWEYAARGGAYSQGYEYSGSDNLGDVAWYADNSSGHTHAVGMKKANELGIFDMNGNVYEWCSDVYGNYSNRDQTNPTGPDSGDEAVMRGGCWLYVGECCRITSRGCGRPLWSDNFIGFRLVLEP